MGEEGEGGRAGWRRGMRRGQGGAVWIAVIVQPWSVGWRVKVRLEEVSALVIV